MKKTKRTAILSVILLHCLGMMAQMSDPREKLSITATVDGNTNSDYYWETEDGQRQESGKLRQGINARLKANLKIIGHNCNCPSLTHTTIMVPASQGLTTHGGWASLLR